MSNNKAKFIGSWLGRFDVVVESSGKETVMPAETRGLSFSEAFNAVRITGHAMRREGWNDKGQWVEKQEPLPGVSKMTTPYLFIHTVQGDNVPWSPSQTDLFAQDWEIFTPD